MTEYRRHRLKGGCYFFTVNLAERNRTLLTDRIELLSESFRNVKEQHPFNIDAIVVLPEHLHTIWTLPEGDDDFSCRWRLIKTHFTKQVEKGERISKSRERKQERGIYPTGTSGKDGFGSIEFETRTTSSSMSTIFITIHCF
ncbi:REP-associated tyrosine transposase [Methylomonas rivi]|uniref:Transposase n=1 Tax=Methylomonas rivi TaxID=2952226 RepID=A0ABT1U4D3_9GAMM|nr:transposase [Methylomonas sp. WSC-6]MCQ8127971.1 transposase [Methylomonas sp. WSC-6]